ELTATRFSSRGLLLGSAESLSGCASSYLGFERRPFAIFETAFGSIKSCLNLRRYHLGAERTHKGSRQNPHRIPTDRNRFSSIQFIFPRILLTIFQRKEDSAADS